MIGKPKLSLKVGWVPCVVLCSVVCAGQPYGGQPGARALGLAAAPVGVTVSAAYVGEYSRVVAGGVASAGSFRHLFTADIGFDMDTIAGVEGGTVFMQLLSVNAEKGGSADAGDIQIHSNIENDRSLNVLYELWYEQLFMGERLRVRVGKVDANTQFAAIDAGGDFANSSAGFSPTIFVFPSYPDPGTSINIFFDLISQRTHTFTLGYGFYDGAAGADGVAIGSRGPSTFFSASRSDDYFHIAEAALAWDAWGGLPDGRLAAGGWWHTGDFTTFRGGEEDGTGGFYLVFEQRLSAPHGPDSESGLYLFGQYGWADEAVSEFGRHIAGGLVVRGLCAARRDDSAGLYVSHADLSDKPGAGFARDETAIDLYYRARLTANAYVQPELQWIINPSGDGDLDDAVVVGVRLGTVF